MVAIGLALATLACARDAPRARWTVARLDDNVAWRRCEGQSGLCSGRAPGSDQRDRRFFDQLRRRARLLPTPTATPPLLPPLRGLDSSSVTSGGDPTPEQSIALALTLGLGGDRWPLAGAVDEGLRLRDRGALSPSSCFNTALAAQMLGMLSLAREQWAACSQIETDADWRREIRDREAALQTPAGVGNGEPYRSQRAFLLEELPRAASVSPAGARAVLASFCRAQGATGTDRRAAGVPDPWATDLCASAQSADSEILPALASFAAGFADYGARNYAGAAAKLTDCVSRRSQPDDPLGLLSAAYLGAARFGLGGLGEISERDLTNIAETAQERGFGWAAGQARWTLGRAALARDSLLEALALFTQAQRDFEGVGAQGLAASVGVLAGEALGAIGQPEPAWRAANLALLRAYGSADPSRVFFVNDILAVVASSQGLPRLALELQDEALRNGGREHARVLAIAHLWRAHLLALLERPRLAREALQLADGMAAALPASRDRELLRAELAFAHATASPESALPALDHAVELFARQGRKDFLVMALHRRARTLKQRGQFAAAQADLERALGLELGRARTLQPAEAARLSFVGTRQSAADELMALQVALHRPWNAFSTLQQVLVAAAPGEIRPQPAPEELSRRLRTERRTALVALTQLDDLTVAWVIAGDERRAVTWPTARKDVRAALRRYGGSLDGRELQLHAGELFELIARPWIELVRGFDELLVIPGSELAAVPFAGLFDQRRGTFLVEDHVLRFGAVADLAPPRTAVPNPPAVVVFEPDSTIAGGRAVLPSLRGARREAAAIAARYPRSTLIRGAAAHRRELLRRLPAASIFHFAGHALPNVRAGEPGLIVSPFEQEAAFVTASDLAALDLSRVELVTLAGCSTARAPAGSWQVSWNLGRAALAAGAPAVLTTIADVADEDTSDLMIDFYDALDGAPARALAEAQRRAIRRWRAMESPRRSSWPVFVLLSN